MKIAIIADVHDNLRNLSRVLKILKDSNIDLLIHCGDWVMPFTLRTFVALGKPIKGVLGNGDPDIQKFLYQLQNLDFLRGANIEIQPHFLDMTYDGKRIGVIHGDDKGLCQVLEESQLFDILCVGHSHNPSIKKLGKTRIVNPGSLVGFLAEKGEVPITYAIYDTISDDLDIFDLEKKEKIVTR